MKRRHDIFEPLKYTHTISSYVNDKNYFGETMIYKTIRDNNLFMLQYFLSQGAKINIANNCGNTPLMVAAGNGHLEIVEYLISEGADVYSKNIGGKTALMAAAEKGRLDIVNLIWAPQREKLRKISDELRLLNAKTKKYIADRTRSKISWAERQSILKEYKSTGWWESEKNEKILRQQVRDSKRPR